MIYYVRNEVNDYLSEPGSAHFTFFKKRLAKPKIFLKLEHLV